MIHKVVEANSVSEKEPRENLSLAVAASMISAAVASAVTRVVKASKVSKLSVAAWAAA